MKRLFATMLLSCYLFTVKVLARFRSNRAGMPQNTTIMLTGQFASPAWASAHLKPIVTSNAFAKIWVVAPRLETDYEDVIWIEPSVFVTRIAGVAFARMWTFFVSAIRYKPEVIAGFHLIFNGMLAVLLALSLGRKSLYFCVGGPAEVENGGIRSENRLFGSFSEGSASFEAKLIRASQFADTIVFMGTKASLYYKERGYRGNCLINPGGVSAPDDTHYDYHSRPNDILFVGRLARIKDIPLFLGTISSLVKRDQSVTATIVGDGEEKIAMENLSEELGLDKIVNFAGYQSNVQEWLNRSKVLLLTSQSEGLSLAVMEAVTSGLPVIAPDVGDLGEAIVHNETGFLVTTRNPDDFADCISEIIASDQNFERLSNGAKLRSAQFSIDSSAERWREFVDAEFGVK